MKEGNAGCCGLIKISEAHTRRGNAAPTVRCPRRRPSRRGYGGISDTKKSWETGGIGEWIHHVTSDKTVVTMAILNVDISFDRTVHQN